MLIILNGISHRRDFFYQQLFPVLRDRFSARVEETSYSGHARAIATAASLRGESLVVAAGGDGTLSQVVNGLFESDRSQLPTLGLIPLGSGNDFARTVKQDSSPKGVLNRFEKRETSLIDVGSVQLIDGTHYFINECSVGMGPEVVNRLSNRSWKWAGASVKYLQAILTTFFTHRPTPVTIESSHYSWSGPARVVAISNGKAFGHSIYIAPDASIADRQLNLFLCKGIPLMQFLLYLQAIKKPKKLHAPKWIDYQSLGSVTVSSPTPIPIEADGELIGTTPLACSVASKKLPFIVSPIG